MGSRIKGITIDIDGNTTKLTSALKDVDSSLSKTQTALRDTRNLLKFEPGNVSLITQQQGLLQEAVEETKAKLKLEKEALEQLKGKGSTVENQQQQQALQREIADTEHRLKTLETQAAETASTLGLKMQEAGKKIKSVGDTITGVGTTLTKTVTAPLVAAGAAAVTLATAYEENLNKVEVSFGASSEAVKDFAKTATDNFGLAESTALEMAAQFGDMGTSMGISQKAAAEMSIKLVGLAGDLASFKNISTDEALTALNGVFTGETESLKRLGVVMTQVNLEAFAESQGKVYSAMSESEKVTLRYQYVLEKTGNAQGDYARTADGMANSTRTLQESLKNLGVAFGEELLPYVTPLVSDLTSLIKKFGSMDDSTKKLIVKVAALAATTGPLVVGFGKLTSGVGSMVTTFGKVPSMAIKAGNAIVGCEAGVTTLTGAIGVLSPAIGGVIAVAAAVTGLGIVAYLTAQGTALDQLTESATKAHEALETQQAADQASIANTQALAATIENLSQKENLSAEEKLQMAAAVDALNEAMPDLNLEVDKYTGKLKGNTSAINANIDAALALYEVQKKQEQLDGLIEQYAEDTAALEKAQESLATATDKLNAALANPKQAMIEGSGATQTYAKEVENAQKNVDELTAIVSADAKEYDDLVTEIKSATSATKLNADAADSAANATGRQSDAMETASKSASELSNMIGYIVDAEGELTEVYINTAYETVDKNNKVIESERLSNGVISEAEAQKRSEWIRTYNAAYDSIMGQVDLFGTLNTESDLTTAQMIERMQTQADAYASFTDNLDTLGQLLAETGSTNAQAFIESLASMGTQGAPYVAQIVKDLQDGSVSADEILAAFGNVETNSSGYAEKVATLAANAEEGTSAAAEALATGGEAMASAASDAAKGVTKAVSDEKRNTQAEGQAEGEALAAGMNSSTNSVRNAASALGDAAGNVSLPDTYTWGTHLADNLAQGIRDHASNVQGAAAYLAGLIQQLLGHTEPAKGPLHGDSKWGAHLADNLATGMRSGAGSVRDAATLLANAAKPALDSGTLTGNRQSAAATNVSYGGFTININSNSDPASIAKEVEARINRTIRMATI